MNTDERLVMSDSDVSDAFASAGAEHGFDNVKAEFSAFKDFKIRWSRSNHWAEFEVSDYLINAPYGVIKSLADTIFRKIRAEDAEYDEDVVAWLTRDEFVATNRSVYIRRNSLKPAGEGDRLGRSVARVADAHPGLTDGIEFTWGKPGRRTAGRSSVLMRVANVNEYLANEYEDVPDDVMDWIVYALATRVGMGFTSRGRDAEDEEYRKRLGEPADDVRNWLDSHGMHTD